ncbi:hypothetical protein GCM10010168_42130 [Actinoplanes ianthinogenes]|uniref:PAS domain S-box-containing protein/diguanylate cyclase (GGDEF)-like protein n=1 Tax=Actinoplanes ianthinogenes TaxID=122358 RepID=A0ABN6CD68_9ACTN|nr:sensor domain-containing diguanylate cyclase [Actinoplanes ianthinogenes]BCJ43477.1 hypothetical protein Aiant_41340 [Actinoplanes ianthinogenes]GGR19839.1 hypothetical protein GCM10010168_42130 [Actinoplanes ianthinogenes]
MRPLTRRTSAGDPILVGLAALAAVVTLWYLLVPAGVAAQVITYRTLQPLLNIGLTVMSVRAARMPMLPRAARRFWYALGLGGAVLALGNASQAALTWWHPTVAAVGMNPFQSVCQVVGTTIPLIVMLSYPLGLETARKRVSFWFDTITVLIATAMVAWYLSAGAALDGRQIVDSLLNCGISVVTVFAVVKLMISGSRPFTRAAAICGVATVGTAGLLEAVSQPLLHGAHLGALLAANLLPAYLSTAIPRLQQLRLRADPKALAVRQRPYSRLPYLAVAVTDAVLAVALLHHGLDAQTWILLGGVPLITAVVVMRQLMAFADNDRLLRQVSRQEERFRALVRHASEITYIVDGSGTVSYASPATVRVLGIEPDEAVGRTWGWNAHPEDLDALRATVAELLANPGMSVTFEMRVRHADGGWRWLETVSTNLIDDPSVAGLVCNARDVSAARQLQEELRRQASHDPLTGLGNRALFTERLAALSRQQTAVILIDLDDFKPVNDTLGHHVGDALLIAAGQRLRSAVRPGDTVVRLGGDEFAVLLPGADGEFGTAVAARIGQAFAEPVLFDGLRLSIKASFGVVDGELDPGGELLRRADEAMYAVKRAGKPAAANR